MNSSAEASKQLSLEGKTVLITGANCGIGYETALELLKRGARVIIACRDQKRGTEALDKLRAESGASEQRAQLELLDLASLRSVKEFADRMLAKLDRLDILINNAGIVGVPYTKTEDGFELTFGVNHLGN